MVFPWFCHDTHIIHIFRSKIHQVLVTPLRTRRRRSCSVLTTTWWTYSGSWNPTTRSNGLSHHDGYFMEIGMSWEFKSWNLIQHMLYIYILYTHSIDSIVKRLMMLVMRYLVLLLYFLQKNHEATQGCFNKLVGIEVPTFIKLALRHACSPCSAKEVE